MLIYFAGHGFMDDGKGYLAPTDIDIKNIKATGLPMEELGQAMGEQDPCQIENPDHRFLP